MERMTAPGVWENMAGASLTTRPFSLGSYVTMVPSLDMLMQVAAYEDKEVAGGKPCPDFWAIGLGWSRRGLAFPSPGILPILGMNIPCLIVWTPGDKMSDGFAPSLRLGKMFALVRTTLLDGRRHARYSATAGVALPIPGQFA